MYFKGWLPKKSLGFTLVELLVAISVLILVSGSVAALISNALRSYYQAAVLNRLQENGSHVMSLLENKIRGASAVLVMGSSITLIYSEETVTFSFDAGGDGVLCPNGFVQMSITPAEGVPEVSSLTEQDEHEGVNVTALSFVYNEATGEVNFSFDLQQSCGAGVRPERQASLSFDDTVVVRSKYN